MDRKILTVGMALLLLIVPVVATPSLEGVGSDVLSAAEQKNISEAQQHQKTSVLTDPKFLTPMSEEEFLKYNQPAIEKMAEKVGKATALENAKAEYQRSVGSGTGNVTPKQPRTGWCSTSRETTCGFIPGRPPLKMLMIPAMARLALSSKRRDRADFLPIC